MEKEKAMYEAPVTKETPVNLESGICAGSYEGNKVVTEDGNTTVDISRQTEGGSFEITSWDD